MISTTGSPEWMGKRVSPQVSFQLPINLSPLYARIIAVAENVSSANYTAKLAI
jgi:hypothetical protein